MVPWLNISFTVLKPYVSLKDHLRLGTCDWAYVLMTQHKLHRAGSLHRSKVIYDWEGE